MADRRQITVAGITLTVLIERKAVKNINARLRDTTLHISAPHSVDDTALDRAIIELARRLIQRVHKRQINNEEDALALVRQVAARFPNPPVIEHATFTLTEARWGSYSYRHSALERDAPAHATLGARSGCRPRNRACHPSQPFASILASPAQRLP